MCQTAQCDNQLGCLFENVQDGTECDDEDDSTVDDVCFSADRRYRYRRDKQCTVDHEAHELHDDILFTLVFFWLLTRFWFSTVRFGCLQGGRVDTRQQTIVQWLSLWSSIHNECSMIARLTRWLFNDVQGKFVLIDSFMEIKLSIAHGPSCIIESDSQKEGDCPERFDCVLTWTDSGWQIVRLGGTRDRKSYATSSGEFIVSKSKPLCSQSVQLSWDSDPGCIRPRTRRSNSSGRRSAKGTVWFIRFYSASVDYVVARCVLALKQRKLMNERVETRTAVCDVTNVPMHGRVFRRTTECVLT